MHPESRVIDEIDKLVDDSIDRGPQDDYTKPYKVKCDLCQRGWHGMRGDGVSGRFGCPGEYASEFARRTWRATHPDEQYVTALFETPDGVVLQGVMVAENDDGAELLTATITLYQDSDYSYAIAHDYPESDGEIVGVQVYSDTPHRAGDRAGDEAALVLMDEAYSVLLQHIMENWNQIGYQDDTP